MKITISTVDHYHDTFKVSLGFKVTPENQCVCCKSKVFFADWKGDAIEQEDLAKIFERLACHLRALEF